MKKFLLCTFILFCSFNVYLVGQSYQSAQGSITGGIVLNTNNFSKAGSVLPPKEKVFNHKIPLTSEPIYFESGYTPTQSIYQEDLNFKNAGAKDTLPVLILKNFQGLTETNSIPPDPYIAVGPQHIMAVVNSDFGIFDKNGNLIKRINADSWYGNLVSNVGAFDPKVLYDHFAKRWIMVWLDQDNAAQRGNYLLSVSDDSIPTGVWYNWVLSSNLNGPNNSGTWGDYQGVGFDSLALYITSNQFIFGSSFQYVKIRIIPKSYIYGSSAGPITWWDLWNISYPPGISGNAFNIRPTIPENHTTPYYLLNAPQGGGNFLSLYQITNPTTNPTLTGTAIPVSYFYVPPNAGQLGGGSPLIDGGTVCSFRFEPIVKGNTMWACNGVRNPQYSGYSALRYFKIDLGSTTVTEDITFGAPGYWFFYNGVAVDKQNNVVMNFSRSSNDEYAGAFFVAKPVNHHLFSNSQTLQTGKGNYIKTFGGSRNRWGDYNGIWLDPTNKTNIFMITEFAAATNTWGTWIGEVKLALENGPTLITSTPNVNFLPAEINFYGDTLNVVVQNFGNQDLVINNIGFKTNNFVFATPPAFPKTLVPYENITYKVVFYPKSVGFFKDTLQIQSNAVTSQKVILNGRGYYINQVVGNKFYASSGAKNTYFVNPTTGSVDSIGAANYNEVKSIAVNPKTKIIYGIVSNPSSVTVVRVNATGGDAYKLVDLAIENANSISFDTTGVLYLVNRTGMLYTINLVNKTATFIDTIATAVNSIAFNPKNNQLWGSIYKVIGGNKDLLIKINPLTGDTINVGKTNFNIMTNDLEFDRSGNLYGLTGGTSEPTNLIKIDTTNGAGTIVGSTGITYLTSLAYSFQLTDIKEEINNVIPSAFYLSQNYPNPFNPTTTIEFGLPKDANIQLTVYDMLGQVVKELFNGFKVAGIYKFSWNADNQFGNKLPSGIYFYELKTNESNNQSSLMKKMILLK
jgi:hypothetical protein